MPFLFEKLEVYQKALLFAEEAMSLADKIPKGNRSLADQLNKAAISVALNIAEGNGRWHTKDRRNFFLIARGSAFECVPILELCRRKKWIQDTVQKDLTGKLEVISKMLSSLMNKHSGRHEQ